MTKKLLLLLVAALLAQLAPASNSLSPEITWDRLSLIIDGRRVCPVMGEIHYSRLPADEWQGAVRRMKDGGVTVVATYVFWNHVEEQQGIFRWDGQRNLRRFLEVCKEEGMPVVLRIGPYCHGEVRCGGIPDWVFSMPSDGSGGKLRVRSTDPRFLALAERLYRQIFTQVQGLQWKDGGPLMACQFDNEYRGSGDYLMALKRIATGIGFDLPFYTRTGWPELSKPVPFGEMIPLYGDYADGFWERSLNETAGNYYQAFNFKVPTNISQGGEAMGAMDAQTEGAPRPSLGEDGRGLYPYLTCELGGGMMVAYHRRPYIYPEDSYSMALVKLGSGSNLLGYYMYHGGTNPDGLTVTGGSVASITTLNEQQRTPATNYNDMPVKNYDFQAPLGEFGQTYPQYYMLRPLHLFMHDYGEELAPMEAQFPSPQNIKKGDDSQLRWAVRSAFAEKGQPEKGFIFVNNYERLQNLSTKKGVQLEACGVKLPRLDIPAGCMAIFPVNIDGLRYATAQLVARRDGKIFLMQIPGIATTLCTLDGKTLRNLKPLGTEKPVYKNYYLLTREEAGHLFLTASTTGTTSVTNIPFTKIREAGPQRTISIGVQKVAEEPTDADFEQAAVYRIALPADSARFALHASLLKIDYRGDVARLYADGRLIADNFYYGRPFLYGLWRLPEGTKELELRILPLQDGAPIYLPREADKTPGEHVNSITITNEGL